MRLFIITDTTLKFKVVEPTKITLYETETKVNLNYWENLEIYKTHGNKVSPLKTETVVFPFTLNKSEKLLDFIYHQISMLLPKNEIIYHKPRE